MPCIISGQLSRLYYQIIYLSNLWYSLSAFFTIFLITPPVLLLLKLLPCQKFHHSFHFLCYPPVKYWKLPSWKSSSLALKLLWSYVLLKPNIKLDRGKDTYQMSKISQNYNHPNISYNLPMPLHFIMYILTTLHHSLRLGHVTQKQYWNVGHNTQNKSTIDLNQTFTKGGSNLCCFYWDKKMSKEAGKHTSKILIRCEWFRKYLSIKH